MTAPGYRLVVAATAERPLARLPESAAAAIVKFMIGALIDAPRRVGHPLQRELALVALIIHQRACADASRAIARQFHHGGLRSGGETRLHRAGRTQYRRAAARRRRCRTFRAGRGRARSGRHLARAAGRISRA